MTSEEYIYSRLGGDSDLADILELFIDEMPARIEKLLRHLNERNWEELRRTAHQLKGAAGSYGFEQISPSANRVERNLLDNEPEERVRESVFELVDLCRRIRSGLPALPA